MAPRFKLNWKVLKFQNRLGSGSFGDCFQGMSNGKPVAIKRMRAGLTDKEGFRAYCREVLTLSRLFHINIVEFVSFE